MTAPTPTASQAITPTAHQQAALDQIAEALIPDRPTLLCGYAGTGKTTLAHLLAESANNPLFLAPTNRAAWVLRSKLPPGARVQTIHSAAMQPLGSTHEEQIRTLEGLVRCDGDREALSRVAEKPECKGENWNWLAQMCDHEGGLSDEQRADEILRRLRQAERDNVVQFQGKDGQTESVGLVAVDEASMVHTDMLAHIQACFPGVPILLIGDPAQLPPILSNDETAAAVVPVLDQIEPTYTLTEVLRQAGDSRILRFATHLRSLPAKSPANCWQWAGKVDGEELSIIPRPRSGITKGLLGQFRYIVGDVNAPDGSGIIVCRRNDTRRKINRELRAMFGWDAQSEHEGGPGWWPVPGERLIVSATPSRSALEKGLPDPVTGDIIDPDSPEAELTKGELLTVEEAELVSDPYGYEWVWLTMLSQSSGEFARLHVPAGLFLKTYNRHEGTRFAFGNRQSFQLDYGLCITVHKAQGSEFDRVAIYEQAAPWMEDDETGHWLKPSRTEHRQWLYTAATRAKKKLLIVAMPPSRSRRG